MVAWKQREMPRKRKATAWNRKSLIEDLATGLPFAGFMLAGAFRSPYYFIAGVGFFAIGFVLQRIRIRRAKCENCGLMLSRKPDSDSGISFHCPACDIVWETGSVQDGQ